MNTYTLSPVSLSAHRVAVSVLFGVNGFLFANYIARLPLIQQVYGLDHRGAGLLLLATAIGALLAMPLTGALIVGQGSRRVVVVSSLTLGLLVALIGLAPNVASLGVLFFVLGISTGAMDVSMNAQAVQVEQQYDRPIMTTFHAIFSAGMMVGAGSGALFTGWAWGLGPHLALVASLGLVLMGWAARRLVADRPTASAQPADGPRFRLPDASLLGIGLIAFCCMLGEGAMADWSTNYLLSVAPHAKALAPLGLAAFSLAMTLARFGGDRMRALWGDRRLLTRSSGLAVTGLALALALPYPIPVLVGLFGVGLGLAVIVPIAYSTAGNTPGLLPGVGISMVTTIGYAGFLLGPPIIGFLADWQSLRLALTVTLGLFVVMMVLSYRLGNTAR